METERPSGAESVEVDQALSFPAGEPAIHGGSAHQRVAASEWRKSTLLRHLTCDHRETGLDERDRWPDLIELHQVIHGVQLELALG